MLFKIRASEEINRYIGKNSTDENNLCPFLIEGREEYFVISEQAYNLLKEEGKFNISSVTELNYKDFKEYFQKCQTS